MPIRYLTHVSARGPVARESIERSRTKRTCFRVTCAANAVTTNGQARVPFEDRIGYQYWCCQYGCTFGIGSQKNQTDPYWCKLGIGSKCAKTVRLVYPSQKRRCQYWCKFGIGSQRTKPIRIGANLVLVQNVQKGQARVPFPPKPPPSRLVVTRTLACGMPNASTRVRVRG